MISTNSRQQVALLQKNIFICSKKGDFRKVRYFQRFLIKNNNCTRITVKLVSDTFFFSNSNFPRIFLFILWIFSLLPLLEVILSNSFCSELFFRNSSGPILKVKSVPFILKNCCWGLCLKKLRFFNYKDSIKLNWLLKNTAISRIFFQFFTIKSLKFFTRFFESFIFFVIFNGLDLHIRANLKFIFLRLFNLKTFGSGKSSYFFHKSYLVLNFLKIFTLEFIKNRFIGSAKLDLSTFSLFKRFIFFHLSFMKMCPSFLSIKISSHFFLSFRHKIKFLFKNFFLSDFFYFFDCLSILFKNFLFFIFPKILYFSDFENMFLTVISIYLKKFFVFHSLDHFLFAKFFPLLQKKRIFYSYYFFPSTFFDFFDLKNCQKLKKIYFQKMRHEYLLF